MYPSSSFIDPGPPIARCKSKVEVRLSDSTVPSSAFVDVSKLAEASFDDHCGIDWSASSLSQDTFTCQHIGNDISVIATIYDTSGLNSTCKSLVTVKGMYGCMSDVCIHIHQIFVSFDQTS